MGFSIPWNKDAPSYRFDVVIRRGSFIHSASQLLGQVSKICWKDIDFVHVDPSLTEIASYGARSNGFSG